MTTRPPLLSRRPLAPPSLSRRPERMLARPAALTEPPLPPTIRDMDPLSDVLRAVRLTGAYFYLVEAGTP